MKVQVEGTRKIKTVFQPHEEKLYVQQDSNDFEREIYARNHAARNIPQTGKGPVRLHLQMSEQDYQQLCLQYPLLHYGTTRQRRAIWEKVAKERPELVAMEYKQKYFKGGK